MAAEPEAQGSFDSTLEDSSLVDSVSVGLLTDLPTSFEQLDLCTKLGNRILGTHDRLHRKCPAAPNNWGGFLTAAHSALGPYFSLG